MVLECLGTARHGFDIVFQMVSKWAWDELGIILERKTESSDCKERKLRKWQVDWPENDQTFISCAESENTSSK